MKFVQLIGPIRSDIIKASSTRRNRSRSEDAMMMEKNTKTFLGIISARSYKLENEFFPGVVHYLGTLSSSPYPCVSRMHGII